MPLIFYLSRAPRALLPSAPPPLPSPRPLPDGLASCLCARLPGASLATGRAPEGIPRSTITHRPYILLSPAAQHPLPPPKPRQCNVRRGATRTQQPHLHPSAPTAHLAPPTAAAAAAVRTATSRRTKLSTGRTAHSQRRVLNAHSVIVRIARCKRYYCVNQPEFWRITEWTGMESTVKLTALVRVYSIYEALRDYKGWRGPLGYRTVTFDLLRPSST